MIRVAIMDSHLCKHVSPMGRHADLVADARPASLHLQPCMVMSSGQDEGQREQDLVQPSSLGCTWTINRVTHMAQCCCTAPAPLAVLAAGCAAKMARPAHHGGHRGDREACATKTLLSTLMCFKDGTNGIKVATKYAHCTSDPLPANYTAAGSAFDQPKHAHAAGKMQATTRRPCRFQSSPLRHSRKH